MSDRPHESWARFFETDWALENVKGPIPTVDDHEDAMRIMGAAGNPKLAAKLLSTAAAPFSTDSLFRIATRYPVRAETLAHFRREYDRAKAAAEPIFEARLARKCGLEPSRWKPTQARALAEKIGPSETIQLARELGATPVEKPSTTLARTARDRRTAKLARPENEDQKLARLLGLTKEK